LEALRATFCSVEEFIHGMEFKAFFVKLVLLKSYAIAVVMHFLAQYALAFTPAFWAFLAGGRL
jgi:hypothetical protein